MEVRVSAGEVVGCVEDDGRGFAEGEVSVNVGLRSMRERAEMMGGTFELSSEPEAGTSVRVSVPVAERRARVRRRVPPQA